MEAVLTMELTTFPFALGKESFHRNSRNDIHIYVYIRICIEILFQLSNEDSKSLFVTLYITNDK